MRDAHQISRIAPRWSDANDSRPALVIAGNAPLNALEPNQYERAGTVQLDSGGLPNESPARYHHAPVSSPRAVAGYAPPFRRRTAANATAAIAAAATPATVRPMTSGTGGGTKVTPD